MRRRRQAVSLPTVEPRARLTVARSPCAPADGRADLRPPPPPRRRCQPVRPAQREAQRACVATYPGEVHRTNRGGGEEIFRRTATPRRVAAARIQLAGQRESEECCRGTNASRRGRPAKQAGGPRRGGRSARQFCTRRASAALPSKRSVARVPERVQAGCAGASGRRRSQRGATSRPPDVLQLRDRSHGALSAVAVNPGGTSRTWG
jgi:hypothetical protein